MTFHNFSDSKGMQERIFAKNGKILAGEWVLENVTIFTLGKGAQTVSKYVLKTPLTFQKIFNTDLWIMKRP